MPCTPPSDISLFEQISASLPLIFRANHIRILVNRFIQKLSAQEETQTCNNKEILRKTVTVLNPLKFPDALNTIISSVSHAGTDSLLLTLLLRRVPAPRHCAAVNTVNAPGNCVLHALRVFTLMITCYFLSSTGQLLILQKCKKCI